ncbi:GPI transamidase component Gaa1 [Trinorchestia longiramus]|nr:GPI transamidase component Gaa1 [Trinorchestia longiramus]
MGLLTDPGMEGGWLSNLLLAHEKTLSILLYLVGVVWFLSLAHNSMNHETYFSENALLPGLVHGEFMREDRANRYLQELNKETEKYSSTMPHAWLQAKMTQLGLDTYTHNFTLHYPMAANRSFSGNNVYGILRAVRGSSSESIVLSAPYRPPRSVHPGNAPAVALMLTLAQFFSEQLYWAKDIIFLVTEHEQLGMEAWLQSYHGTSPDQPPVLDYGRLPARAGPIQAAVNLEISDSAVSHVDIRHEGLNGQLPNLDLVNLVHRLCHRESVDHTVKSRADHPRPDTAAGWRYQLLTLLSSVATQATGVPSGNHGLFHRFGIAAVTVSGERGPIQRGRRSSGRSATLLHLGRVLEGTCRSLNNLLERFHQSFFFYLLPATSRYISIGVYMPAFGAMGSCLLLGALSLWCSCCLRLQLQQQGTAEQQNKCCSDEQEESIDDKTKSKLSENKVSTSTNESGSESLVGVACVALVCHSAGAIASWWPRVAAGVGATVALSAEDSVCIGALALALTLLRLPAALSRGTASCNWQVVKCAVQLELAVLVFAGALLNFSLALVVTAVYAPVVIAVSPSTRRLSRWCKSLLLLLVHPLSLVIIFASLDTVVNFPDEGVMELLLRCVNASKRALMYSVVDSLVYGNWVYPVACWCLMPVWLMLWHVQHSQPLPPLSVA